MLSPGDPTTFSQPPAEWAVDIGGTGTAYGVSTTVLGGGNVLLVGGHDQDLVLGRGSPTETTIPGTGVWSLFAGCYGADGSLLWTRSAQASEYVAPYATTALPDGGFVVTGFFAGVASFADGQGGSVQATSIGQEAAFLVCFDARGTLRWFRQFGAPDGFAEALALTTLADGGVAVTGLYSGHLTVGAGEPAETSMTSGELDTFVARFTSGRRARVGAIHGDCRRVHDLLGHHQRRGPGRHRGRARSTGRAPSGWVSPPRRRSTRSPARTTRGSRASRPRTARSSGCVASAAPARTRSTASPSARTG